jgi:hypothetical protein
MRAVASAPAFIAPADSTSCVIRVTPASALARAASASPRASAAALAFAALAAATRSTFAAMSASAVACAGRAVGERLTAGRDLRRSGGDLLGRTLHLAHRHAELRERRVERLGDGRVRGGPARPEARRQVAGAHAVEHGVQLAGEAARLLGFLRPCAAGAPRAPPSSSRDRAASRRRRHGAPGRAPLDAGARARRLGHRRVSSTSTRTVATTRPERCVPDPGHGRGVEVAVGEPVGGRDQPVGRRGRALLADAQVHQHRRLAHHERGVHEHHPEAAVVSEQPHGRAGVLQRMKRDVMDGDGRRGDHRRAPVAVGEEEGERDEHVEVRLHHAPRLVNVERRVPHERHRHHRPGGERARAQAHESERHRGEHRPDDERRHPRVVERGQGGRERQMADQQPCEEAVGAAAGLVEQGPGGEVHRGGGESGNGRPRGPRGVIWRLSDELRPLARAA